MPNRDIAATKAAVRVVIIMSIQNKLSFISDFYDFTKAKKDILAIRIHLSSAKRYSKASMRQFMVAILSMID